ncbi:MAG: glycosyltransferase family 39 protein [Deltaproteobacteria bacterium]|nr:glycosyltransferase family 39 protein [Deltaproteobacteria bacterium]
MKRHALVVFLAAAVLGLAIDRQVPWTDDARFYVPAAASYGEWLARAVSGPVRGDFSAWSRHQIDTAFRANHEHPPAGKYVMAVGWLVFYRGLGWLDEIAACRVGVTLLWAWLCALTFALVRDARGPAAGLFAALATATMPRLMFHGQVETLDLPVTAFTVASATMLWRTLEAPRLRTGVAAVLFFAFALGTQLNAPFILVAAAAYLLITRPPQRAGTLLRLPDLPLVLAGMLLLSPLLVWLMWPWLWFDTWPRLVAYAQYHLHHYGIYFLYRGELYSDTPAPWHAPWVMLAFTVPLPVLALALCGAWPPIKTMLARLPGVGRPDLTPLVELERSPAQRLALFVILQALVQLVAVSLPGVPVYGGDKLFLPAFPFAAVLSGLAFAALAEQARAYRRSRLVLGVTMAALLLPGALGVLLYRGSWLSYYNELAGGVRGATRAGYERQYYDLAYPELATALNQLLPNGGRVAVLPNPKEYAPYFARWRGLERLHQGVELAPLGEAHLLVLTHERRWREYPELHARFRTRPLAARFDVAGVPLFSIYDLRP